MEKNAVMTLAQTQTFIAGDDFTLRIQAKKSNGSNVDLTTQGTVIEFVMCTYDGRMPVLEKKNNDSSDIAVDNTDNSLFYVYLNHVDTQDLHGAYSYQVVITLPNGSVSRRLEGVLDIWERNRGANE